MNNAVMVGVALLVVACGLGITHSADPHPKDIVFEDKPLRRWLEELAGEGDVEDYTKAQAALRRFCAKPERAVPALTVALADKNEQVRVAAIQCLSYFCQTDAKALIPPLLKSLQTDEVSFVRVEAARGLGIVGLGDDTVIAAMLKALKEDKDGKVRAEVISEFECNLLQRGKPPAAVLPDVIKAMKDPDEEVQFQAALAVGKLGEPKTTIPLLFDALQDKGTRYGAELALAHLCPEAIPALCKAMKDKDPDVRCVAVRALGRGSTINTPILKELPAIMALLDDKNTSVRACAAGTLGQIKAVAAVPALVAKLGDEEWEVRQACIGALGTIRPDSAAVIDKLIDRLKNDRKPIVRLKAAQALGSIGPKAKAAVPALIEALKDKDEDVALWTAHALGLIGPDAKAAVPQLKAALKAKDERLKRMAKEALENIGAE